MGSEHSRIERVFRSRQGLAKKYVLDNPGNQFNFNYLCLALKKALASRFTQVETVSCLDVGSGTLFWPEQLVAMGMDRSRITGVDLLAWRLKEGLAKGYRIDAVAGSADRLPFPTANFDVVTQFTMMTSVLDLPLKREIAAEMIRVLRPGGYIFWYDFRYTNPANHEALGIGRRQLRLLFPGQEIALESVTLLPPLARRIPASMAWLLKFVHRCHILRTHYLAVIGPKG